MVFPIRINTARSRSTGHTDNRDQNLNCVQHTDSITIAITLIHDHSVHMPLFPLIKLSLHTRTKVLQRTAYAAVEEIKSDRSVPVEDRCSHSNS